jgi:hypothetical protein
MLVLRIALVWDGHVTTRHPSVTPDFSREILKPISFLFLDEFNRHHNICLQSREVFDIQKDGEERIQIKLIHSPILILMNIIQ